MLKELHPPTVSYVMGLEDSAIISEIFWKHLSQNAECTVHAQASLVFTGSSLLHRYAHFFFSFWGNLKNLELFFITPHGKTTKHSTIMRHWIESWLISPSVCICECLPLPPAWRHAHNGTLFRLEVNRHCILWILIYCTLLHRDIAWRWDPKRRQRISLMSSLFWRRFLNSK